MTFALGLLQASLGSSVGPWGSIVGFQGILTGRLDGEGFIKNYHNWMGNHHKS
jgi:hypothetical protein